MVTYTDITIEISNIVRVIIEFDTELLSIRRIKYVA